MGDRSHKLRSRYGLTETVYSDLLKGQGNVCKICGECHTDEKKLHVDHYEHNDKTVIKGLLCGACNSTIAFARHTPQILRLAANYLETR